MGRVITPEEFEELFLALAPELGGYLRRRGVGDADDLVADVFVTAWRRRDELPAPALRRAWLFGVARRLVLADGRRAREERTSLADLARQHDDAAPREEAAGRGHDVVLRALARLSDADRELLQLAEWERLTPTEIAVALGIRPGAARTRLHRARRALVADPELQAWACTLQVDEVSS